MSITVWCWVHYWVHKAQHDILSGYHSCYCCSNFGADIACFKLFAYTAGETVNCQKEINISDKTTDFH